MRIGVFTTFLPEYTFPEACRLIKSVGYDGVQPRIVPEASAGFDPAKPFNPWGNNKGGISEAVFCQDPVAALRPAADAGLAIASVASYASTADMPRAVAMVKACARAGVRHVRIAALPMPQGRAFDFRATVERSRDSYRELVQEARRLKVRPCIELHMGTPWPGPSGIMHLLSAFAPEEVGVLYDPGNMISDGWETPVVALSVLGPYLAEVHVKNSAWVADGEDPRGYRKWKYAAAHLEEGLVDWGEVIGLLKERGFDGWLVEEGHAQGRDSHTRIRLAHDLLRKLL